MSEVEEYIIHVSSKFCYNFICMSRQTINKMLPICGNTNEKVKIDFNHLQIPLADIRNKQKRNIHSDCTLIQQALNVEDSTVTNQQKKNISSDSVAVEIPFTLQNTFHASSSIGIDSFSVFNHLSITFILEHIFFGVSVLLCNIFHEDLMQLICAIHAPFLSCCFCVHAISCSGKIFMCGFLFCGWGCSLVVVAWNIKICIGYALLAGSLCFLSCPNLLTTLLTCCLFLCVLYLHVVSVALLIQKIFFVIIFCCVVLLCIVSFMGKGKIIYKLVKI